MISPLQPILGGGEHLDLQTLIRRQLCNHLPHIYINRVIEYVSINSHLINAWHRASPQFLFYIVSQALSQPCKNVQVLKELLRTPNQTYLYIFIYFNFLRSAVMLISVLFICVPVGLIQILIPLASEIDR